MEGDDEKESGKKMKFNPNDPKHWKDFDPFARATEYVDGKSEASIKRARSNRLYKTGIKDSDETKLKKSMSQTGRIKPDHAEKLRGRKRPEFAEKMKGKQVGENNGNSRAYEITEPNGKTYIIFGLKGFAKKLKKPFITAYEMATGKYPDHSSKKGAWAGWTIKEK